MCNWAVYSGNTTWSHFHSCNILVVKYKSQNVFIQKSFCDLFLLLFFFKFYCLGMVREER